MSCEICGGNGHRRDLHDLADRIAKLETVATRFEHLVDWATDQTDRTAKLEAAQLSAAAGGKTSGDAESASRPGTPAAAGPIPPGYKLAPWWAVAPPGEASCTHRGADDKWDCDADALYINNAGACAIHAVEMGAIVKVESPQKPSRDPGESPMTDAQYEEVAHAAHEAVRAYCKSIGDPPLPAWEQLSVADTAISVAGAEAAACGQTPEESHETWLRHRSERGWKYGERRDPNKKLSPNMIPYSALPAAQKRKDDVFVGVATVMVKALRSLNPPPAEQPVSAAGEERDPGAEYEEMNQQRQRLCRDIVEAHKERDEAMAICGRAADEILRIRAERDAAVAAERERCLYHVETYEPRRDLSADWNYYGALNRVAEAIRSGEPAPK